MAATQKRSQKTKKHAHIFPWRKVIYIFCAVIIGLVATIQIALDVHFWRAPQYGNDNSIVSLIIQAVKASTKPAVIEPMSKKVYIPDANLVLPPQSKNMPNLEYSYVPSYDSSDAEANVTTRNAIDVGVSKLLGASAQNTGSMRHHTEEVFKAVPGLQVCVRGVHVVFGNKTTYDKLEFTKQLADGREMHIYTEAQKCAYDLRPLVTYLRDAESY